MDEPTAAQDLTADARGDVRPEVAPEVDSEADHRSGRRSVRWILTTVVVSLVLIAGLGLWVATSSTEVKIDGRPIDCDALVSWGTGPAADAKATAFERSCDHQRDKRRTTALLFGVGIATVAAAVSTVPSRRLTGEALGPPA